jgi:peptide/nickel transport system substrate-binding protein
VSMTRRELARRAAASGLLLSAPGILAACADESTASLDRLTWLGSLVPSLDMAREVNDAKALIIATEPILTFDKDLKLVGHLAESWEAKNPRTYVYKVRKGVKFWDGSPLTAEDVAYSIQRHKDPKVGSLLAGLIPTLAGVEVSGPLEVTVRLEEPNATWAGVPASILVVPKAFAEEQGKDLGAPNGKIMGTGPYEPVQFAANDHITYARNEDYWGEKPIIKKLVWKMVQDPNLTLLAVRSGDGDGTFGANKPSIPDWKKLPDVTVITAPTTITNLATFDVEAEPWDDVHVRRAFAYALDRKGLINALYRGENIQLTPSIVAKGLWGDQLPKERVDEIYANLPSYDFDLDKARAELKQSRYPGGLDATIWYYQYDEPEKIALAWADDLKKIGVNLKLEPVTDAVGAEREDQHKDLGFHGPNNWGADFPDPISLANTLLPSKEAKPGHYNEANYKNPTVDKLIAQNLASTDQAERGDLLAQVMEIAARDVPYVPFWNNEQAMAIRKGFTYDDGTPGGYNPNFQIGLWTEHIKPA